MKTIRKMTIGMIGAFGVLLLALTACGGGNTEPTFSKGEVDDRIDKAKAEGASAEAKLADAKLARMKQEMSALGRDTARLQQFVKKTSCDTKPNGFDKMDGAMDFPLNAFGEYKAACQVEVASAQHARDTIAANAAAAERRRLAQAEKPKGGKRNNNS